MILKIFISSLLIYLSNPCEDVSFWNHLLHYKIPSSLNERLSFVKNKGFEIQHLSDNGGKILNLDYFPVHIKTLPKNPVSGEQFKVEDFLTFIRLNFNDFVNQKYASFSTSPLLGDENKKLWLSENPIGAIIHINIPFPAGDGSVICTEFSKDHWVYATIQAPWRVFRQGNDGKHPVTGLRQMGFIEQEDGTHVFYTKGVDRMSRKSQALFAENFMRNPFKSADKLWESLRKGIFDFVQKNGGSAVPLDSTKVEIYRIKWKKAKMC